eukprot:2842924-Pleurochrysis_carterae.AAC.1
MRLSNEASPAFLCIISASSLHVDREVITPYGAIMNILNTNSSGSENNAHAFWGSMPRAVCDCGRLPSSLRGEHAHAAAVRTPTPPRVRSASCGRGGSIRV